MGAGRGRDKGEKYQKNEEEKRENKEKKNKKLMRIEADVNRKCMFCFYEGRAV